MSIVSLWLPILVSAALVWIASAIVWMVMPWHKTDFKPTSDEEGARAALKGLAPGNYMLPFCQGPADFKDPELQRKLAEGPQAFITVVPNGMPQMGGKLVKTLVFYFVVSVFCAHIVAQAVTAGSGQLAVFHFAALTAFLAYGVAFVQDSIWFGKPWSITAKNILDAVIYGLVTGGVFAWLAV